MQSKSPLRSKTPSRFFNSQFHNHSMLPLERRKNQRNSVHYAKGRRHMNFSELMPNSMDPRAFARFDRMGRSHAENSFTPGFLPEEPFPGTLNRFSLNRANNK